MPDFISKHGFVTSPVRSNTMRRIKSKNTKPELILRHILWQNGIRYRIQNSSITGNPDLTIRRKKVAIFVDGDFWHGHNWEIKRLKIVNNRDYWIPKIEKNIERDKKVSQQLLKEGWEVIRLWETDILKDVDSCFHKISSALKK